MGRGLAAYTAVRERTVKKGDTSPARVACGSAAGDVRTESRGMREWRVSQNERRTCSFVGAGVHHAGVLVDVAEQLPSDPRRFFL